jgi:hypothetical protein
MGIAFCFVLFVFFQLLLVERHLFSIRFLILL